MKGASDKVADSRMERWDYSFTRDSLHPKDESHRSNFSLFFFSIFLTTTSQKCVEKLKYIVLSPTYHIRNWGPNGIKYQLNTL